MRRSLGRFSLILGSASLLFGCPSDDSSGEGSTGDDPTTGVSMSGTTAMSTSTSTPGTSTGEESSESGPGTESSGSGTGPGTESSGSGTESSGSGTAGALDFQLNLMGYDPHIGSDIYIKVFAADDTELGETTGTIDAGTQSFSITGVIADGDMYAARWWVDLDGGGTCDPQPDDHMWEFTGLTADGSGLIVDHTHDTDWTDVCPFWR